MVDRRASRHLSGYKEVLSNPVGRETSLKIILGENSTYPVKGFGSVKFDLDFGESVLLHEVMYVPGVKKNMVSIYSLEDKGMRVEFIRGKVLYTWPMESRMRDAFTLGSRVEGLYTVNKRPLLEMVHDTNHQSEL